MTASAWQVGFRVACGLLGDAFKITRRATKVSPWNSVLDALGGGRVKRAESAGHTPFFNGAVSMNVPPHAGSIHDISRLFGGMDSSYSQTAAVSVHKQRMDSL